MTKAKTLWIQLTPVEANALMVMLDSEMEGRFEFEARILKYTTKFGLGKVPRPEFWSGFRMKPRRMEFWQDRKFRLHDRHIYIRNEQGNWDTETLYP